MRYFWLLSLFLSTAIFAENSEKPRVLLLAGGHLPVCSSVNLHACPKEKQRELELAFERSFARLSPRFHVDEVRLRFIEQTPFWPTRDAALRAATLKQLRSMNQIYASSRDFFAALGSLKNQLSDDAISLLEDVMEADQIDEAHQPRREQVRLKESREDVQLIWQSFVQLSRQQSGKSTPLIGIITAASHDALGSVDYLSQTIEQAGGKAIWISIEPRWFLAKNNESLADIEQRRQRETGAFFRARHYPVVQQMQINQLADREQFIAQIHSLDAVFFGGGDQTLLLRSLFSLDGEATPEFLAIKQRYAQKALVIGGTSAGTAVQSGSDVNAKTNAEISPPMISNGSSSRVFGLGISPEEPMLPFCEFRNDCPKEWHPDQLSYRSNGGLGFFNAGVLDTHFSERARAGRLVLLLAQNFASAKKNEPPLDHSQNHNFAISRGFGVDETTALISFQYADRSEFGVIGHRGVWVAENFGQGQFMSHYLRHGDQALLRKNQLTVQLNHCTNGSSGSGHHTAGEPLSKASLLERFGAHEASLQVSDQTPMLEIALDDPFIWRYRHDARLQICTKSKDVWSYQHLPFQLLNKTP